MFEGAKISLDRSFVKYCFAQPPTKLWTFCNAHMFEDFLDTAIRAWEKSLDYPHMNVQHKQFFMLLAKVAAFIGNYGIALTAMAAASQYYYMFKYLKTLEVSGLDSQVTVFFPSLLLSYKFHLFTHAIFFLSSLPCQEQLESSNYVSLMEMVLDDIRSYIGETIPGQRLTNPPWDLSLSMGSRYLKKTIYAGNMASEEISKFSLPTSGISRFQSIDIVLFSICIGPREVNSDVCAECSKVLSV